MINKTFRVFISSTFSDFLVERNILNNDIYSYFNNFCKKLGYNFQLIDLRWGVNFDSAFNQKTLDICLGEVKRCCTLSPKPNFLLMLGERYGWIPLPSKISKSIFEKILENSSGEETKILADWYILDENKLGGEYVLKSRQKIYVEEKIWNVTETKIHDALINSATKAKIATDIINSFTLSATEKEIIEGLLESKDVCDNTIAVIRKGYPEKDVDQSKISNLKERIVNRMLKDNCGDNLIELNWDEGYDVNFKNKIINILQRNILNEISRIDEMKTLSGQRALFDNIIIPPSEYIEQKKELSKMYEYINGDSNEPLWVVGNSGSGKTTLLVEFIKQQGEETFFTIFGLDENSYTFVNAMNILVERIKEKYGITRNVNLTTRNISEKFWDILYSISSQDKIIILIDGFDMFYDINEIHENIFPQVLPRNVKLIVSAADEIIANKFILNNHNRLVMQFFSTEKSKAILESALKKRKRQITSQIQREKIMNSINGGTTPLQLKLVIDICSKWHSSEIPDNIAENADKIALIYMTDMYKKWGHDKELVLYALALIAVASYGVSEDDLQKLLFKFNTVKSHFISEDRYNYKLDKLPFIIWSRLFYDLKGCLTLSLVNGRIVVKFIHGMFEKVIINNFSNYCNEARNELIEYLMNQKNYIEGTTKPNIHKGYSIAILLINNKEFNRLLELVLDYSYIDAVVKLGKVNELINTIQIVIENTNNDEKKEKVIAIYNCLQNNRNMLNCYYNNFSTCAYECGLLKGESIVENQIMFKKSSVYFPYSRNAKLVWNNIGKKYIVCDKSYIYICDAETSTELCRIYIRNSENERGIIIDAIWLNEDEIAVVLKNRIYVYSILDRIPKLLNAIDFDLEKSSVKYYPKKQILLLQRGKTIEAISPYDNCINYTIKLKKSKKIDFEIDLDNDEIIIKQKVNELEVYSIDNGKFIRRIFLNASFNYYNMVIASRNIRKINDSKWFVYNNDVANLIVYDTNLKSEIFLHPPYYPRGYPWLIEKGFLFIIYREMILKIDLLHNYEMEYFVTYNVMSISWTNNDAISLVLDDGIQIVGIEEFQTLGNGIKCLGLRKNVLNSFLASAKYFQSYFKLIPLLFNIFSNFRYMYNYDVILSDMLWREEVDSIGRLQEVCASIIEFANDGKCAVAYEEKHAITVFDANSNRLVNIDNMKLSLDNNILKLLFSNDSSLLLIWRNKSIQVVKISDGRCIANINISRCPILNINFSNDSSEIQIVFVNGEECSYSLINKKNKLPRVKIAKKNFEKCETVYNYFYSNDKVNIISMINEENVDNYSYPNNWYNNERIYRSNDCYWLYFNEGEFYLNGDLNLKFSHENIDFNKSRQLEQLRDSSIIRGFLREKNDLFSNLFYIKKRYLVLASRMLDSLILFDVKELKIIMAYKYHGHIVNSRLITESKIEIICDKQPYNVVVKLNIE